MTDTEDDNWGWVKTATNYRRPADLIRNLIDRASKGGDFVLNVGLTADGEFPLQHLAIIDALGKWTSTNGEAIYGTVRPGVFGGTNERVPMLRHHEFQSIFLHVTHWPSAAGEGIRANCPHRSDQVGAARRFPWQSPLHERHREELHPNQDQTTGQNRSLCHGVPIELWQLIPSPRDCLAKRLCR